MRSTRSSGATVAVVESDLDVLNVGSEGVDELLSRLFVAHSRGLVALARLLVDDMATAEDVVQDAFAETYRHWSRIRNPDAALPYLRSAVINHARKKLRERQRGGRVAQATLPEPPDPRDLADELEREHLVLHALRLLPYRQRQVVVLRYYLDLSEAQIADQLGMTRGSVHQHGARAALVLRRELTQFKDAS